MREEIKKKISLCRKQAWILWLLPILINLPGVHAQTLPLKSTPKAGYEPGVMVIKFVKDSAIGPVAREVFEKTTSTGTLFSDPVLETLLQKYEIIKVVSLDNAPLSAEDVKQKFPGRSRRIPAGYTPPSLEYAYKVEFQDKSLDVPVICIEFEKSPQVEYAQPDYVVTTRHTPQKG